MAIAQRKATSGKRQASDQERGAYRRCRFL